MGIHLVLVGEARHIASETWETLTARRMLPLTPRVGRLLEERFEEMGQPEEG